MAFYFNSRDLGVREEAESARILRNWVIRSHGFEESRLGCIMLIACRGRSTWQKNVKGFHQSKRGILFRGRIGPVYHLIIYT